jgi:hypothetical protein
LIPSRDVVPARDAIPARDGDPTRDVVPARDGDPARDVDLAELRRLNEGFLLKQQISTLQGEKQLVVQQLTVSITTIDSLRADIDRNRTAHGIDIERFQKHVEILEAEKEHLEHRIAEFIATFEMFKATENVHRETIATHVQTIETLQEVNRSLIGDYQKLEAKRCRDESFQTFYSQSEIALASNVTRSPVNASSPNQASTNSLASITNVQNPHQVEAISQSHTASLHQRPSQGMTSLAGSDHVSALSAITSRSSTIYSTIYPSPNDGRRNTLGTAPEAAGDLPIQQGNSRNPFRPGSTDGFGASSSPNNISNPLVPRPVDDANIPGSQTIVQSLHQYSFLISGSLETGPLASIVPPELQTLMSAQIVRWDSMAGKGPWYHPSIASTTRCVDTRRRNLSKKQSPLADNSNGHVACGYCVGKKQLCVLVGRRGPIILPLPASHRPIGVTAASGNYYLRN